MRKEDYERLYTERSFEPKDNPIANAVSAVADLIDRDSERSAKIVTNPDSTYGDRVASAAPLPGPATVKAGRAIVSGLKTASGVGKGAERTRKAAAAANKVRKDPKKVSEAARGAAKKTGKKARRTGQKAKTKEGRREIAKGTAKGAGRAGKAAGKKVAESRVPPLAAAPIIADEAGVSGETVDKASALAKGTVTAPVKYPKEYVATTGRGILGLGAAFGQAAYAGGNTVVRGARAGALRPVPGVGADYSAGEVVAPITDLAKQEWEGTKEIGRELLSGDQERVEKAYADELGALPFVPVPWIARKVRNSENYQSARSSVRESASAKVKKKREEAAEAAAKSADKMPKADRRGRDKPKKKPRSAIMDPKTDEEYAISNLPVVRSVGGRAVAKKIQRRNIRKAISLQTGMETQIAARETVLDDKDIQGDVARVAAPKGGRNAFFRKVEEAVFVTANRGIPFSEREALGWIDEIRADKTPDTQEVGGVRESRVLDFIEENPQLLSDPAFQSAVNRATSLLDSTTTSRRAKFLPVARVAGIATPEERLAEGVRVGGKPQKVSVTERVPEPVPESYLDPAARALARKERRDRRRAGISERRTERRRATRQSKAYDPSPEAINERVFYQGGNVEGLDARNLDPDMTQANNLFGMGIYLTTSAKVAKGYRKARSKVSGRGQLYRAQVRVKNPLDLDAPLDPRFRDRLIQFAEYMEKNGPVRDFMAEGADSTSALLRRVAADPKTTNADLYSVLRKEVGGAAREAGYASYDLDDEFIKLRRDLVSDGWDSLTHRGGKRTGGRDHQTVIVLDPAIVTRFDTRGNRPVGPEPRPVGRVPKTRTGRRVRTTTIPGGRVVKETVTNPRNYEQWAATIKKLRSDSRAAESRGDVETAMELRAQAKALDRRLRNARAAYKKAESDFIAETEGFIAERGLRTPARLTDSRKPVAGSVKDRVFGNARFGRARRNSRATQKSEGILLREDTADRSREGVWNDSVLGPRLQRVYHGLTKGVIQDFGFKITIPGRGGKSRKVLEATSREHQAALDRGELPDDVMLIDAQYYRAATGDKNAGSLTFQDFLNAVTGNGDIPEDALPPVISGGAELRRLAREDRAADPGKKYIAVDREAMLELVGQIEGFQGAIARGATKLNRGTSSVILGWNPSFIGAQQIAEGGPALTAAMTANPASIARMVKAAPNRSRGTNRQRAEREAMYGISGGTFQFRPPSRGGVIDRVDQLTEPRLTKPSKALGLLKDAARGRFVNNVVLRTGASYRRLVGLAELDRRGKRTVGSLGKLVTRFGALERKFKGKSLAEVEDYFAANPKLRAEIRSYLNDVMGDFSTLTRLEARYAPGIAFYPYLRYSLRWAFYAFPQRHPVRASILYFLSQVNAEQLEELVGNGEIADWLDYAYSVVSKDGEPYPLPAGTRFTPAGSNVFQSLPLIAEGNPNRLISSLNPGIGAILNSALGRDSFSGEQLTTDWWERFLLGLSGFAAMAAPIRAINEGTDLKPLEEIKVRRDWKGSTVGEPSESAKEFDSYDPNRVERGIAPWGPLIGQSASDYRKTNRKARKMKRNDYSSASSKKSNDPLATTDPFSSGGSSPLATNDPFK
jgi:hypothetical protein